MGKPRDPRQEEAFEIWKSTSGKITNREIARQLDVDERRVADWKKRNGWLDAVPQAKKKRRRSLSAALKGNKNALGNKGGKGGPVGNRNAVVTGEFSRVMFKTFDEDSKAVADEAMISGDLITITRQLGLAHAREAVQLEQRAKYEKMEEFGADYLQRCEEALTRTQGEIRKLVADRHRIEMELRRVDIEDRTAGQPITIVMQESYGDDE